MTNFMTWRGHRRVGALVAILAAVFLLATAVSAWAGIFWYHGPTPLAPGGFYSTDAEVNRLHNRVCRDGNSGQMSAQYWIGSNPIHNTGAKWTNCPDALAALENDGVYRSRCKNEGTVSFPVICQTTRP